MGTSDSEPLILLTGATGYVGGRLLNALQKQRRRVRCMARRPELLSSRTCESVEVVKGDLLDPHTLPAARAGVQAAYYLVHSMGSAGSFEQDDRQAATIFAEAAGRAGVRRIIYLGGLAGGSHVSRHLASRLEVGRILRDSDVQTIELRASIIIGRGSLSFEMIRALVNRLPVMVTPRWVGMLAQPIAIDDVVAYLLRALDVRCDSSEIYEIGGADQVSYLELMREYARQRGLRRLILPVPVLTPWLSSLWLGLVTPLQAGVGRKLIDSIRTDTVVQDSRALRVFDIRPRSCRQAISEALSSENHQLAQTR